MMYCEIIESKIMGKCKKSSLCFFNFNFSQYFYCLLDSSGRQMRVQNTISALRLICIHVFFVKY